MLIRKDDINYKQKEVEIISNYKNMLINFLQRNILKDFRLDLFDDNPCSDYNSYNQSKFKNLSITNLDNQNITSNLLISEPKELLIIRDDNFLMNNQVSYLIIVFPIILLIFLILKIMKFFK